MEISPESLFVAFEGSRSFVELHEPATMREFEDKSFVEVQINFRNVKTLL